MKLAVIACEVMRYELELICTMMPNPPRLFFLPQGLHDTPKELTKRLQEKITQVESEAPELTHLALGYGLCGKGLEGISLSRCTGVLPQVHDCIPLLLGDLKTQEQLPENAFSTYWFSPGWLTWSVLPYLENQSVRFDTYRKKYGEARAATLVKIEGDILSNYTHACLINWPGLGDAFQEMASTAAKQSHLPLKTIAGHDGFLTALLSGSWNPERFLLIPPGRTPCQSMERGEVICLKSQDTTADASENSLRRTAQKH